jgi:hypothetical protein
MPDMPVSRAMNTGEPAHRTAFVSKSASTGESERPFPDPESTATRVFVVSAVSLCLADLRT